jgi:hypothetical protein
MNGDLDQLEEDVCADCGAVAIAPDEFTFGDGGVLCLGCAGRRGGQYDREREAWLVPPDISDIAGAYRPF